MDESHQDLGVLEDIDPSLEGGFKIQFNKEINIETRISNANTGPQEIGTLEQIKVKILVQGDQQAFENLKIELTSETDLFFNYIAIIDKENFKKIKEEQKLTIEYPQFLQMLIKLLNSSHKEPNHFFCVFFMQQDGSAKLDFIENLEYKFMEMLTLEFSCATEETIRQNVSFRYNFMKAKLQFVQNKLNDITSLIKLKNPSLLAQLNKVSMNSNQSQTSQNVSKYLGQSRKNNLSKFI
ncbi:unnamed protein product [Paramecium pentaurelia]|uniref:Spindle assembly abnormal protein 6 N-terminal domain-containing protein n=1 Tax=Paramecium pentaurelia TaxID=43138 RepID=A0A8S1VLT1_9CILI|nr:unnamed protein product [Paramecium pentaurelia]